MRKSHESTGFRLSFFFFLSFPIFQRLRALVSPTDISELNFDACLYNIIIRPKPQRNTLNKRMSTYTIYNTKIMWFNKNKHTTK